MNFNFGEVLTRAWKIAWNHKILWGFGFLSIAIGFLILPLMFLPMFSLFTSDRMPAWLENPWYLIGWFSLFIVVMIASLLVSPLMQVALTLGAFRVEQGAERLSFGELFHASRAYYWRFLGVMAIYIGSIFLVNIAFSLVQMVGSILTLGLASLCLTPLSFLMFPVIYVALAWMELADTAIVVHGMGVMESVRHTWQVIRENKMAVVILTLVLYLGVGIVASVFAMPMMLVFFAAPFSFISETEMPRTVLIISGLCLVAYLPIYAVLQGGVLAFIKSGWVVGYLQLTQPPSESSPAVIQANA